MLYHSFLCLTRVVLKMKRDFFWKTKNDGAKGAGRRRIVPVLIAFAAMMGVTMAAARYPWDGLPLLAAALVAVFFARMVEAWRPFVLRFLSLALVLASVMLIQAFVPEETGIGNYFTPLRTFSHTMTASLIILAPLLFVPWRRAACALFAALYAPAMMCALFLWGYFFATHRWASGDTFVAIAQTHASEAMAYWSGHMGVAGTLAVLLLAALAVTAGRFFVRMPPCALATQQRAFAAFLLVIDFLAFAPLCLPKVGSYYARVISEGYFALENLREFRVRHALHADVLAAVPPLAKGTGGLHVLVLGESENKTYMHAYGYEKDTTPWLDAMKNDAACIFFAHAYSCHTYTDRVLTYALTEKSQYNDVDTADALSILELANAAGYRTIWLSNQGKNGISDTPVSIIASDAETRVFLNEHQYLDAIRYDEELLPALDDVLAQLDADGTMRAADGTADAPAGTLIVVHLLGCHETYRERYPRTAAVFDDRTRTGAYENAVRYSDDIVRQIYEHAKQAAGFRDLVYFSDHGEAVASGSGHNPDLYEPCMTYIPFYILFSETGRAARPDACAALRANASQPFTNDLAYELLATLLGLAPPRAIEPRNNPANPAYDGDLARLRTCHGEREITPDN